MEGEEPGRTERRTPRSAVLDTRPEYERLGRWLREQRERLALQQKPVSRRIGKPDQFLNKVERGRQRLDLVEFLDLFREMGLDTGITVGKLLDVADGKEFVPRLREEAP